VQKKDERGGEEDEWLASEALSTTAGTDIGGGLYWVSIRLLGVVVSSRGAGGYCGAAVGGSDAAQGAGSRGLLLEHGAHGAGQGGHGRDERSNCLVHVVISSG
jgi:hypothetical protein